MYKIIAVNLGSTSTKFAYYEDDRLVVKKTIDHPAQEIRAFATIWDQLDYRMDAVKREMAANGIEPAALDAVVTRGGHTEPLEGGTYLINQKMLDQSRSEKFGNHACDLGLLIASRFARDYGVKPFTVDPPVTDEFEPLARYSGLTEFNRRSSFHALNHRAAARQYAKDRGIRYEDLNLVGVHMGGGISVCAHKKGRMVDANNGLIGDGPFSTNRTGTLPAGPLIDMCFSGEYTRETLRRKLNGHGGIMAYLGETDMRIVEDNVMAGDKKAEEAVEAMCYQVAKEIGAMATVLKGDVDAIFMTGGIARSEYITGLIIERVKFIAPVALYPGEYEMQSLGLNAYEALRGAIPVKEL